MQQGEVVAIFTAPVAKAPMQSHQAVRAVPGQGLEGDRYNTWNGTFCKPGRQDGRQAVTLIESESIDAIRRDQSITLGLAGSRRNIVTRGIALNHLVDREFNVGDVLLKGVELCEPCGHLESLTQHGIKSALMHRAGLRAEVLTAGVINVGDSITVGHGQRSVACV